MKKSLSLFLIIIIITSFLFGCNLVNDTYYSVNKAYTIYDADSNEIATVNAYFSMWLVDDKLIYARLPKAQTINESTLDFYCYNITERKEYYLGRVKKYTMAMADQTVIYNQHIYMPLTIGDIYDENEREYVVYDIDLENKKITKVVTIPNGFHYNTMTVVNDKILITNLQNDGSNTVEEYDINTQELKTVINFDKSTNKVNRTITADENYIYTLKVVYNADHSKSELYLDYYDFEYNLLKSVNLADIFDAEKQAQFDETDQGVVSFFMSNGYMYYENFSGTEFLGKIEQGFKNIMPNDSEYYYGKNIDKRGNLFVFYEFLGHTIYLFSSENGELKKCDFYGDNEEYAVEGAVISGDDKLVITMIYRNRQNNEELPTKLYYVSIDDLDFVDVDVD